MASQRIQVAAAALARANVLWLPTINLGVEYSRHDGQIQETPGMVFGTNSAYDLRSVNGHGFFALSPGTTTMGANCDFAKPTSNLAQ